MIFGKSRQLQKKSHALIPGGCHTYAKGDDQYPELAPGFIARGNGCHVWDVDGNEYIEYGMGNRCVGLGHAYPAVVKAAQKEMLRGTNFVRPAPIEIEAAEELLALIDAADMVKFAKNGSDTTTAAVKLARAHTGRDLIAICADHPFFSTDDWFIGTTAMNAGIPRAVKDMTLTFRYDDLEDLRCLFDHYPNQIAGLILEAAKYDHPANNYLQEVQRLCRENETLFILDEMITGFRWHLGGAQKYYDIEPDLSTFGKALGNGFAVAALAGKREFMEVGGLNHDKERVFLLSTTHGAETHGLAAAIATMQVYKNESVIEYLGGMGRRLRVGIEMAIENQDLTGFVEVVGLPCNMVYATKDQDKKPSQSFRTLFLQELIKRGVIGPSLVVSFSHTEEDIDRTVEIFHAALGVYKKALEQGVEKYLHGLPSKVAIRKYC